MFRSFAHVRFPMPAALAFLAFGADNLASEMLEANPGTETRKALGLTDGSLSANLSKLEDGGLVETVKGFAGRRPQTVIRLTAEGRRGFRRYVEDLKEIVPGLDEV